MITEIPSEIVRFVNDDMFYIKHDKPSENFDHGVVLDYKQPYISTDVYTVIAYKDSFDFIAINGELINVQSYPIII